MRCLNVLLALFGVISLLGSIILSDKELFNAGFLMLILAMTMDTNYRVSNKD